MTPASATMMDDKTITGAATQTKTLVMWILGCNVSILHGEQLALIMALILSQTPATPRPTNSPKIDWLLTDHLNSVRLIEDSQTVVSQTPTLPLTGISHQYNLQAGSSVTSKNEWQSSTNALIGNFELSYIYF